MYAQKEEQAALPQDRLSVSRSRPRQIGCSQQPQFALSSPYPSGSFETGRQSMVSMKPIFRETADTFFGIAFLYRLKERRARWLTQPPATLPILAVPCAQPLRAVPSVERRLRAKVTEQLCHWPRLPLGTTPGPGRRSVLSARSAVFVSLRSW